MQSREVFHNYACRAYAEKRRRRVGSLLAGSPTMSITKRIPSLREAAYDTC